jgi:hypothetical protein
MRGIRFDALLKSISSLFMGGCRATLNDRQCRPRPDSRFATPKRTVANVSLRLTLGSAETFVGYCENAIPLASSKRSTF